MTRARRWALCVLAVAAASACSSARSPEAFAPPLAARSAVRSAPQSAVEPFVVVVPLAGVSATQLERARTAGRAIRFFHGSIQSPLDGKTYRYKIVGANPALSNGTTTIPFVPMVLVVHYPDGTVLDPREPACNDNVSVADRFLKGPNFVPSDLKSNGIDVGKTQLGDAFQRAEFWTILRGPQYHTILQASGSPVIVQVNAPASSRTVRGVCFGARHRVGEIPIVDFDRLVVHVMDKYATPSQLAFVLTYNTFQLGRLGGCCITGLHGSYKRSAGIQTFAIGAYNDPSVFPSIPNLTDINTWTHEIGETLNDPFGSNKTPAWGDVGQYPSTCSTLFEVGDPLNGTAFPLKAGGFVYHPQDLAFFSWFFRTRSTGTGGKYSFRGTFTKTQGPCNEPFHE